MHNFLQAFLKLFTLIESTNCLSKVDHLAPNNPFGSDLDVAVLVDEDGTLPTELEGAGGQVLVGCGPDDLANLGAAGVEDVVEALLQQGSRFLHSTVHNLQKHFKDFKLFVGVGPTVRDLLLSLLHSACLLCKALVVPVRTTGHVKADNRFQIKTSHAVKAEMQQKPGSILGPSIW